MPLFAHNNGQWSKKVRGKIHHFGTWADQAALEKWIAQKDALRAGLTPRTKSDALSIGDHLANHFLTSKQRILDAGESAFIVLQGSDSVTGPALLPIPAGRRAALMPLLCRRRFRSRADLR